MTAKSEFETRFERICERFLSDPEDRAAIAPDQGWSILPGNLPVLFTAPHAVEHVRKGEVRCSEPGTGALAVLLHEERGCAAACKTRSDADDANYDERSPFRDAVHRLVAEQGIKVLFDLHQLRPDREFGVIVGTGEGRNIFGRDDVTAGLVTAFVRAGMSKVVVDQAFRACTPNTVAASTARECSIPCFQIELNSRYLLPGHPEYRPEAVFQALWDAAGIAIDRGEGRADA